MDRLLAEIHSFGQDAACSMECALGTTLSVFTHKPISFEFFLISGRRLHVSGDGLLGVKTFTYLVPTIRSLKRQKRQTILYSQSQCNDSIVQTGLRQVQQVCELVTAIWTILNGSKARGIL